MKRTVSPIRWQDEQSVQPFERSRSGSTRTPAQPNCRVPTRLTGLLACWFGLSVGGTAVFGDTITITNPSAGAQWAVGSTYTIQWNKTGTSVPNVAIQLTRNINSGSPTYETLTSSTPNDGSYSWTVTGTTSNYCQINIHNAAGGAPYDNSDTFTIVSADTITVTNPGSGTQWSIGQSVTIQWTKTGTSVPNVVIQLSRNINSGSPTYETITSSTPNDGSYTWTVTGAASDYCQINIHNAAGGAPGANSAGQFKILSTADTTPPSVTITVPTSSSTYTTTSASIDIAGNASDNVGVTQVTWSNDRGGSGTCTGTTSWSRSGIALQSGQNILTVTGRDAANNNGTDVLTVTYNMTQLPDLTLIAPTSLSNTSPAVGDSVIVAYTMRNQGNAASAGFYVSFFLGYGPTDLARKVKDDGPWADGLAAGQTVAAPDRSYTFRQEDLGYTYFIIKIDGTNVVSESDENNNLYAIPVSIGSGNQAPTISSVSVTSTGQPFRVGMTITAAAYIADDAQVKLQVDWDDQTVNETAYGSSRSVSLPHVYNVAGPYTVLLTAIDNGTPQKTSQTVSVDITIEPNPQALSLSVSPTGDQNVPAGTPVAYTCTVTANGNAVSGATIPVSDTPTVFSGQLTTNASGQAPYTSQNPQQSGQVCFGPATKSGYTSSGQVCPQITLTALTGSLRVTIEPAGARGAAAWWRVDGGPWHGNGATVSSLASGIDNHTLEFSSIAGWIAPASRTTGIAPNLTTYETGVYELIAPTEGTRIVDCFPDRNPAVTTWSAFQIEEYERLPYPDFIGVARMSRMGVRVFVAVSNPRSSDQAVTVVAQSITDPTGRLIECQFANNAKRRITAKAGQTTMTWLPFKAPLPSPPLYGHYVLHVELRDGFYTLGPPVILDTAEVSLEVQEHFDLSIPRGQAQAGHVIQFQDAVEYDESDIAWAAINLGWLWVQAYGVQVTGDGSADGSGFALKEPEELPGQPPFPVDRPFQGTAKLNLSQLSSNDEVIEISLSAKNWRDVRWYYPATNYVPSVVENIWYDRTTLILSIPTAVTYIDATLSPDIQEPLSDGGVNLVWFQYTLDKGLGPDEQTPEIRVRLRPTSSSPAELSATVCLQVGPFRGEMNTNFGNDTNPATATGIYDYSKFQSAPGNVYWYAFGLASKTLTVSGDTPPSPPAPLFSICGFGLFNVLPLMLITLGGMKLGWAGPWRKQQ